MITGTLSSIGSDILTYKRLALLNSDKIFPNPQTDIPKIQTINLEPFIHNYAIERIKRDGLLILQLDQLLSNENFIKIFSKLGTLIPEHPLDAVVKQRTEQKYILNILTNSKKDDINSQPFTVKHLTLHTECSRRKIEDQPKYLVFMCCESGLLSSAQTLLIKMQSIYNQLTEKDRYILERTSYQTNLQAPPILRKDKQNRNVFSFRDFYPNSLHWSFEDDKHSYTKKDVNEAIMNLLLSLYTPLHCSGITWKKGMIVVIDNTFFFHGKSNSKQIDLVHTRHLKRLRII